MKREEAYQILTTYLKNQNLIKHCLACEVAMKALYKRLNPNFNVDEEAKWGIVGLLHDADYELTKDNPEKHGLMLFEKEPNSIPSEIEHAIKAHNFQMTKVEPSCEMDFAIACVDQLTGLIVAAALIHPEKKLAPLTADFILNRMKEKSFAKGVNRESIKLCEENLEIPLKEFVEITLNSMQSINKELGL